MCKPIQQNPKANMRLTRNTGIQHKIAAQDSNTAPSSPTNPSGSSKNNFISRKHKRKEIPFTRAMHASKQPLNQAINPLILSALQQTSKTSSQKLEKTRGRRHRSEFSFFFVTIEGLDNKLK